MDSGLEPFFSPDIQTYNFKNLKPFGAFKSKIFFCFSIDQSL